jgi:hypothetical protein
MTSNPSRQAIERLHRIGDMIEAQRRVLVCRIAHPIENASLLVCNPGEWIGRVTGR